VIRDPKDIFVSSYFFLQNMIPLPSVAVWAKLFQSDDFNTWGSWAINTAGYWSPRLRTIFLRIHEEYRSQVRGLERHFPCIERLE